MHPYLPCVLCETRFVANDKYRISVMLERLCAICSDTEGVIRNTSLEGRTFRNAIHYSIFLMKLSFENQRSYNQSNSYLIVFHVFIR